MDSPISSGTSRPRCEPLSLLQASQQILIANTLRTYGGHLDLLTVGDSLVQNWQWDPAWTRVTEGRNVLNFGLGGDRTENLLWRLEQRLVDSLPAPRAILLIGINDIWSNPPASTVISGIVGCAQRMRQGLPHSDIAIYGLFPLRGKVDYLNFLVNEINLTLPGAVAPFDISFRNIGSRLRDGGDEVPKEFMPDGCHMTEPAYQIWADDLIQWISESQRIVP